MKIFIDELRRARTAAGLSQEQLAEEINYSQSLVSKVESGERSPSKDFASRCDEVLKTDGLLARLLEYHPTLIRGLLQTEEYARALLSADPGATTDEVDRRVAARMERQSILSRVAYVAVLDESALRRPVAEPKVMHDQLMSLLDRPAELQVIEFGAHPGLNGPLVIATFDGSEAAYVEGQLQGRVLERRDDLLLITRIWETLRGEALSKRRSRELILEVADSWKP